LQQIAGEGKAVLPAKQQDAALSFKSRQDVEFERRQDRFK
jgi:hypothetical protein